MTGRLLLRGMLAGLVAGLLCFALLRTLGEPQVDRAIAFEAQLDAAKAHAKQHADPTAGRPATEEEPEPELVSRPVQAGLGLFTGVIVYSVAFGGLFSLAFALVFGRGGSLGPRAMAALLAAEGFVAVSLVPAVIYPASPPAVGDPDTIVLRTGLYFGIIALSLVAMIAASMLRRLLLDRLGGWNAAIAAAGFYLVAVASAALVLPRIDEVPAGFPAVVLWTFRVTSLGAQGLMWTAIGLVFGVMAERLYHPRRSSAEGRPYPIV